MSQQPEPLIPVFVPPLANVLAGAQKQKSAALEQPEVEAIRDKAVCIMMPRDEAAKMDASRGFVDVNPRNVWADWHRLRPQMVGGYLPRIILCVPGGDDLRERCQSILKAENVQHEFRKHDPSLLRSFRSSSIAWPSLTTEDFSRIGAHSTVLYLLSEPIVHSTARSIGLSFLNVGRQMLDAGGIAIKSDSSGISHSRTRWSQFAESVAQNPDHAWPALFHAYPVYPIASNIDLYSCGMHLLGMPDLIVSQAAVQTIAASDASAAAAAQLFRAFAMYLLMECPTGQFTSGHTFSTEKDAPRFRVTWEPCTAYPESSYFFNPFGRWRFST